MNTRRCIWALMSLGWLAGCGSAETTATTSDGAAPRASDAPAGGAGGAVTDAAVDATGGRPAAAGGTWERLADLPVPRQEAGVAALRGLVYVVGGFLTANGQPSPAVHAFDPKTNTWRVRAPLPFAIDHANVAAVGDRLYLLGPSGAGRVLAYDPDTDTWTALRANPGATGRSASAVAAIGTRIYVAGGGGGATVFAAYDTAADAWETLPALPVGRDHLAGVAVGTTFYAIGGRNPLAARTDAFDTLAKTWSQKKPMPTPRAGIASAAVGGMIVVMGGEGNRSPGSVMGIFPEVEGYDVATDTWRMYPPMRTARHGIGAATVDDKVYVPGGATREGYGPGGDIVEVWTP